MKPIKKIRLSESIIKAIKQMIVEEKFEAGDKFYSENELTKVLEVSRASIREAIRILEVTGQVTVKQGKGVFIMDPQAEKFAPFITWLKTNEQAITDNFKVRLIIEPQAAACAAKKTKPEEIKKMEEACVSFESHAKSNNRADIVKCDREFHRFLAKATQNSTLHVLMKAMTTSLPNGWISSLYTPGRIEKTIHEHRAILESIKNRDEKGAEQAMKHHLENALDDIRLHMNGQLQTKE